MSGDPIAVLTGRDEALRWVAEFRLHGRVYLMRASGGAEFGDGWAKFPVFAADGRPTKVLVWAREGRTDRVEVLSRFAGVHGSRLVPEAPATAA